MQGIGYITDHSAGVKLLLLVRQGKNYRNLKIRQTGKDGVHFSDEEIYLNDNPEQLNRLKSGCSIIM